MILSSLTRKQIVISTINTDELSFAPRGCNACMQSMLINVDGMKRDDARIVSAPGCYIMHQLIGDRVRRRSALDDGKQQYAK